MPERDIPVDGVINFRDLGGYRTADGRGLRWGRLFRSGALHYITEAGVARLEELGVRSVLDLRRDDEIAYQSVGAIERSSLRRHWLPLVPVGGSELLNERHGRGISGERYRGYLGFGAEHFVRALELLADESSYPALFHCTAGKDRTGVIAALVLDILGVDGETIREDYALSNRTREQLIEQSRRDLDRRRALGQVPEGAPDYRPPADWLPVPPDAIAVFLDVVHSEFGSSRGYFEAQGVAAETFERLADALLE